MTLVSDRTWPEGRGPVLVQVALATFGILALELALIRWMSGQVRILAYFNNLILIGCFLGMGTGVLLGTRRPGLVHLALPALAVLAAPLAFSQELGLLQVKFPDPSVYLWGASATPATLAEAAGAFAIIMALFCGVVAVFLFAGGAVGHLLTLRPGLGGYSADLVGSLLGVLAVAAVTAAGAPPPVWLALGALPFAWLSRRAASVLGLAAAVAFGQLSVKGAVFSPYNRIDLYQDGERLTIDVNRDFHQYLLDTRNPNEQGLRDMYDVPFTLSDQRGRALVVGAGTGNDVQAALRNGYGQVYSVDIDGRIIDMGRRLHPERPYSDPRVVPVVDDGRAFFEQYQGPPFDVVCFGFVDSHAMFSALSTLRLDNYLYTEEGLRSAWRHVGPGGHMTVNLSFVSGPWMLRRLQATLARATGATPFIVDHGLHRAKMMVTGRDTQKLRFDRVPFPVVAGESPRGVLTTSDDWPFLYLRPGMVPWGYILVMSAVLVLAFGLTLWVSGPRTLAREFDWALFLMGAAFLLLETRGVTSLSLLFGSTWVVNAAVFSGVLVMALAANVAVQRLRPRSTLPAFVVLLASVLLLWLVDVSALNRLPLLARGLVGGALTGLPIGCAGIAVSVLLARADRLAGPLGANLLGAVVGGCLEYLSMYTGLRAIALMALGLYLAALLIELRRREAPDTASR